MIQKLVTFSDSVLRVDSATIYECWKNGDIVDVRFDGQTYFVSADFLADLASEGLIHQDGICGKGWTGTDGFCKRVKKIKEWVKKAQYRQSEEYMAKMIKKAESQPGRFALVRGDDQDHQDGICGKGWLGNTGFCKRVTKVKEKYTTARNAAIEKERLMTPDERNERTRKGLMVGAAIGGTIGLLSEKGNRRVIGRNLNNFARKAGESAGRAASKYKRRGTQVSKSIGALPPGFRTITETF